MITVTNIMFMILMLKLLLSINRKLQKLPFIGALKHIISQNHPTVFSQFLVAGKENSKKLPVYKKSKGSHSLPNQVFFIHCMASLKHAKSSSSFFCNFLLASEENGKKCPAYKSSNDSHFIILLQYHHIVILFCNFLLVDEENGKKWPVYKSSKAQTWVINPV